MISTIEAINEGIGGVPAQPDREEGGMTIDLEVIDAEGRDLTAQAGDVRRGTVKIAGRSDGLNVSAVKHQFRCPT